MGRLIVDFHSHMLPQVDDGSQDPKTSLRMLGMARDQGVQIQVLSPHYYPWKEKPKDFLQRREQSAKKLCTVLPSSGMPTLLLGAEVAFFPGMSEIDLAAFCVSGTRSVMIEMPFSSWDSDTIETIARLALDKDLHIILAHVERFMGYEGNVERLQELSDIPVTFQLNAGAFLRFSSRRTAFRVLETQRRIVLGSDAHNCETRKPNLMQGRKVIEKHYGSLLLHRIDYTGMELVGRETEQQE